MAGKGRPKGNGDAGRDEMIRSSSEFLGHGLTFAASTLVFLWLGHEADEWLGTDPFLALGGLLVGGAAGFWSLYSKVTAAGREAEERARRRRAEKGPPRADGDPPEDGGAGAA